MACLNMGSQVRIPVHRSDETNVFGDAVYGVGPGLTRNELGAYGEKLLGSSSAYMQSNISRYLSNPQHYFQVNDGYVKKKLKVILFPFLHRGHWMRATEKLGGQLSFKPPIHDINAPDLYLPGEVHGVWYLPGLGWSLLGHQWFSPEALGVQLTNGPLCWLFQVLLLEATLHTLGDGDVPPLDVIAFGGYIFAAVSVVLVARILCRYSFHAVTLWECFCMATLLVKILQRVLIAEMRSCYEHSGKRHYLLPLVAFAQVPLLFWLGNVGV